MKLFVIWGDLNPMLRKKLNAKYDRIYQYPEISFAGGSGEPGEGGWPINPDGIYQKIKDIYSGLAKNHVEDNIVITTYSEVVIWAIRLLRLEANVKTSEFFTDINIVIPNKYDTVRGYKDMRPLNNRGGIFEESKGWKGFADNTTRLKNIWAETLQKTAGPAIVE